MFWQITDIHWDTRYSLDGDPTNMCHNPLVPAPKAPIKAPTSSSLSHGTHLSSSTDDDSVLREDSLFQEIQAKMEKISHPSKSLQFHQHAVASPTHKDLRQTRDDQIVPGSDGGPAITKTTQLEQSNGRFGNYLCDAPWELVKTTLDAMVTINSKPDFILWTGYVC